jgi:hypothetical protein
MTRHLVWVVAGVALLAPAVAMHFTDEVKWDAADFVIFGGMLIAACLAFEIAAALMPALRYRVAAGLAIAALFVVLWIELAVGIIGPG